MLKLQNDFQSAVDSGLVSCRKHPTDNLWILNYTPECQFSKSWNDTTLQCRGLIINAEGQVIARPFRKFFNLSEHDNPDFPRVPYGTSFKAYEKMDGSLGIAYYGEGGWEISTRGSFESEQAEFATRLLTQKYSSAMPLMKPELTYLFEIIYPENRIVVDYGDAQELVLLGVIRTCDGVELPLEDFAQLPFRQPQTFDVSNIESLPQDTQNFEGYVIRFENGLRVKVKLDNYVRLHKLMTGVTPNRIWEMLASGQDVESAISELPDEFHQEIMNEVEIMREYHASMLNLHVAMLEYLDIQEKTRKEQAQLILETCKRSQSESFVADLIVPLNTSLMFTLLDRKLDQAKGIAWKLAKPKDGNKLICKADLTG